ncbi:MAG: NADP-dependent oxidoreductase [Actinomycetaceae bacterium]|nr:NADP-dependent oxidoreductase [Arcanobacterium sp.]MDD7504479.1 NADP-dependent oxidoreductase [Actinomycetaceae bacterium]MDY6142851.1 NADP-dependent oxidoreductase [Arcanobacterium sp.]
MRKLIQRDNTGIDAIELANVEEPHASAGEVRVKWFAGGLNPIDWKISTGLFPLENLRRSYPIGFGSNFSGVIDEVGDGVEGFAVGDRVFGSRLAEGYGDYIVNKPKNLRLHHVPEGLSMEVAAGLVTVAATAVAAIDDLGEIEGKTILIGGAAGGVGILAVQYATTKGARVIGTGSPSSADFLRSLGAEPVAYGEGLVDRVREALHDNTLTAASDLANTDAIEAAIELGVAPERTTYIAAPSAPEGAIRTGDPSARADAIDDIAHRIARGEMHLPIEMKVPLSEFRTAIDHSMNGHAHGKILIMAE